MFLKTENQKWGFEDYCKIYLQKPLIKNIICHYLQKPLFTDYLCHLFSLQCSLHLDPEM